MEKRSEEQNERKNDDIENIERVVLSRLMVFNSITAGLVTGLIFGGVIFLATNYLLLKGGSVIGPHLALLGQFFIGYQVSFVGSLIGFAYGLVSGFIVGYVCSKLYNRIASLRHKRRS